MSYLGGLRQKRFANRLCNRIPNPAGPTTTSLTRRSQAGSLDEQIFLDWNLLALSRG